MKSDANPHLKNDDKFGEWLMVGGAKQNLHFVALSKTKDGGKEILKVSAPGFFLSSCYCLLLVKDSRSPARSRAAAFPRLLLDCPLFSFFLSFFSIGIRPLKKGTQKSLLWVVGTIPRTVAFRTEAGRMFGTAQNQNQ